MKELTFDQLKKMNDERVIIQYDDFELAALVAYHTYEDDGDDIWFTNNLGGRSTYNDVIIAGGRILG